MSSDAATVADPGAGHAIRAQGLSKCYDLFERPSDRLKQLLWGGHRRYGRQHWAVHDVSFSVAQGEVVGIVGRNGAGKSTLLQMVCGTLQPTAGELEVRGRVAALLELGAGFNPDFTGVENVRLNAALLGLTPAEIDRRMDEILAFADIGDFVDQPVKTYSSGMYVRLAFAVATSVDPRILVVDEALSVGDGAFARKSFERVMHLREGGASILLCSHSLYHVQALCNRALWLEAGRVRAIGPAAKVTADYETALVAEMADRHDAPALTGAAHAVVAAAETSPQVASAAPGTARLRRIEAWTDDGQRGSELAVQSCRTSVRIRVEFSSDPALPAPTLAFGIGHLSGITVSSGLSIGSTTRFSRSASGEGCAELDFPRLPLLRGDYHVTIFLACERGLHVYEMAERAVILRVSQQGTQQGLFLVPHEWVDRPEGRAP